ncbi:MAG TPA: response regulator [Stellaceae bacterium]|jgi:DNA-binding response OmpR family regulator|nr:response regulator [Stellaceae bacterium]
MSFSVLIIDDSKVVRRAVEATLTAAGYGVLAAANGNEGMQLWEETQPGLVITDIMMPERDGIETIMEIRRQRPQAKILAMTGFHHSGSVDFGEMLRRLGADDVLLKPFDPEVLLAKVDRLINLGPVELSAA